MARIETSSNLVGKTITLLDGTKAKITGAIASGYQHNKGTKRIPTRCVVKKGAGFAEIEKLPMSQLTDTGEGYVEMKAVDAKPAKTSKAAKTTKATAKTPRAAKTEKAAKPSRKSKAAEEPAEPRSRVRRKKSADAEPVMIQAVDEDFATALGQRLFEHLKDNDLLRFNADNVTPIANGYDLSYGVEFAEPNMIHITMGIEYAMPQPEPEADSEVTLDDAVVARAAKKVGKTVGKKLAAAIKKAYGIPADEFLPGTVLSLNEAEFIYCGPSKDDADTAYLYSPETDKFRPVTSVNLSKYELVTDDEEEEEEDEEEDEEEEEEEAEGEEAEGEEAEGDAYSYVSVTKEHLADVSKSVTAKYHQKMADMWGIDADVLVPGLVLTDGETTFAYVGFNSKGGLLVIDVDSDELMVYKKADVDTLDEFAAVVDDGDDAEAEAEDDAEEEDGDDEEEEEEEDGDDDFDFDDNDGEDFSDLTHDELVDKVTELGLAKPRAAAKMSEDELRELLAD